MSFCILVTAPFILPFDMIGLEDEEDEDVEFCAYASRGAAFNATVVSPVIATTTNPSVKNVDNQC
jgi:hypothetical protein